MADTDLGLLLRGLRRLANTGDPAAGDDRLLERFIGERDQDAFAALLRRHGPLVWRVCRRMLRDRQDAEDAFQATFLVLARKAGSVRNPGALASFLYGAAFRIARKSRARAGRHPSPAGATLHVPAPDPVREAAWRELEQILGEEVQRLPEKYRTPILLCYWEGKTCEEVARQLGWPGGTVKTRLIKARQLLHDRLVRRGVSLSAGAVALLLSPVGGEAAVPPALTAATAKRAAALAEKAMTGLAIAKGKIAALFVSIVLVAAGTGAVIAMRSPAPQEAVPEPPAVAAKPEQPKRETKVAVDRYDDPLPRGAVARLGTKRFRHEGEANSLVFFPNGQMLAARTAGGVILWDARTGKEVRRLSGVTGALALGRLIDFSPDGRTLVGPQGDHGIGFWDVGTGQQVRAPELPDKHDNRLDGSGIHTVCFSPDGKFLVVLGDGNRFHVLDAAKGTVLHHFKELVGGFAFAPDGKTLAVGAFVRASKTFDIQIRNLGTGEILRRWEGHSELMCDMAFSPDGKTLAAGGTNRITLWDADSGKVRIRIEKKKMGQIVNLAFTPDGKTLVSGSELDGKVHVWDVATGEERRQFDPHLGFLRSMALSPDGTTVATGGVYNTIRLWDLATGRELFSDQPGHDSSINAVAYSPDGKLLVSAGENRQVWLWDTTTDKPVRSIRLASAQSVAFSPDGRRLALLAPGQYFSGKNIIVCDVATGKELFRLPSDDGRQINALAYSPDGKTLVSADWKAKSATDVLCNLNLWDASTGRFLRRFSLTGIRPESIAFRDDGRTLAVGGASDRELIRLWDLERGEEILALHRHDRDFVSSLAFSPDGRTLITGGADRTVRLWEVATGKAIHVLKGHPKAVATVAFSPDGRTVASGSDVRVYPVSGRGSDAIRLWDMAGGDEIQHFEGHNSNVPSLAFSPDGTRLASGLRDSTVLLWQVPPYRHSSTRLRGQDLQSFWSDLAGEDAGKAYAAIRALADDPQPTVSFLEDRLRPAPTTPPEQIRRWIADLDSEEFAVRQAARKELQARGEEAIPLLRERLAAKPSLEVRKHIEDLLAQTKVLHEGEILRGVRAAAVLERIGSPEARRVLERLAHGAPTARLTHEVNGSLERLARRAAAK